MMGFLTSLLEEFWTGKGTLQQIGIATPSVPVLVTLSVLAGGATLFATVQTLVKAQTGKLEPRCVAQANGLYACNRPPDEHTITMARSAGIAVIWMPEMRGKWTGFACQCLQVASFLICSVATAGPRSGTSSSSASSPTRRSMRRLTS